MGGKRNFAKARSKDSAGRIQKGHFGRRRLDMLAKGIGGASQTRTHHRNSPPSPLMTGKGTGVAAISLAHARSASGGGENEGRSAAISYIPGSTKVPSTPVSGPGSGASVGSSGHRSRVLEAVDTEPMFMRATLNRILAMPDLACLQPLTFPAPIQTHRITVPKRRLDDDEEENFLARKKQKKTYTDVMAAKAQSDDEIEEHIPIRDTHEEPLARSNAFSDVEYVDDPGTSHWPRATLPRPRDRYHRSKSEPALELTRQDLSSLPPSSEQAYSSDSCIPDVAMNSQECVMTEYDDKTPPPAPEGRRLSFSLNNLFEHENPWHTIGVILGLSPKSPSLQLGSGSSSMRSPILEQFETGSLHLTPFEDSLLHDNANRTRLDTLSEPESPLCRTPSPANDSDLYHDVDVVNMQSPFRLFLESKKQQRTPSPVFPKTTALGLILHPPRRRLNLTEYDESSSDWTHPSSSSRRSGAISRESIGTSELPKATRDFGNDSDARRNSSGSRTQFGSGSGSGAEFPRTPPPREDFEFQDAQSPFRLLLAAKKNEQNTDVTNGSGVKTTGARKTIMQSAVSPSLRTSSSRSDKIWQSSRARLYASSTFDLVRKEENVQTLSDADAEAEDGHHKAAHEAAPRFTFKLPTTIIATPTTVARVALENFSSLSPPHSPYPRKHIVLESVGLLSGPCLFPEELDEEESG
ncbi:hypothetical protein H0H81_011743 [Sphagnurus paluster]|uniref:Uncharacterized protein n=1 Tax=Sphagnurus paluster TaxID=117069 RepID=A0A9P7KNK7_9AGAR|nr:hypothetical protein H0H81_011743 [Sphagnurus paluster]